MTAEDTTAQLREQIETDAIRAIAFHPHCKEVCENYDGTQEPCYPCGAIFRLCDALDEARAQVEAAKATARRDALTDAAFVMHRAAEIWRQEDPSNPDRPRNLRTYTEAARILHKWSEDPSRMDGHLRARASAQGAAAPAEVYAGPFCCRLGPWEHTPACPNYQRPGGQGAQSSGHELPGHDFEPSDYATACGVPVSFEPTKTILCGKPKWDHEHAFHMSSVSAEGVPRCWCGRLADNEDPVHDQRGPGQPGEQDTAEETTPTGGTDA